MKKKKLKGYAERYRAIFWGEPKAKPKRRVRVKARPIKRKPKEVVKGFRIPSPQEIRKLKEDYPQRVAMSKVFKRKAYKREVAERYRQAKEDGIELTRTEAHKPVAISERIINYWETGKRRMSQSSARQYYLKRKQTDDYYKWFRKNKVTDPYADEPVRRVTRDKPISLEEAKAYAKKIWLERRKRGQKRRYLNIIS